MIQPRSLRLIKNYLFLSSGELLSKLVTLASVAYLARVTGPASFGLVEFSGSVLLCASLIVDNGFGLYGAREIAKNPQHTNTLVSEIVLVRLVLGGLAYLAVVAFAFWLDRSLLVTQMLLVYGLSLFGLPFFLQWVFQGHQRMQTVAVFHLIRQSVYAVFVFLFVRSAAQILYAGVAELAGVLAAAGFGIWMYHYQLHGKWQIPSKINNQIFKEGIPIGLSQIFWTVRLFGATVLLGIIALPEDIGFFGSAMRVQISLYSFVYLYFYNLLPALSQAWLSKDGSFRELENRSIRLVAWLATGCSLIVFLAAPVIIQLIYGAEFTPAVIVLQILVGVLFFAALSGHYRFGLIAAGHQKAEMVASGVGALVVFVLIPIGYSLIGVAGAAAGLLVAELIVWLITWGWSRWKLSIKGHLRFLVKPGAAGLITSVILVLLPVPSLWWQLILVTVTFAGLAVIFEPSVRPFIYRLFTKNTIV